MDARRIYPQQSRIFSGRDSSVTMTGPPYDYNFPMGDLNTTYKSAFPSMSTHWQHTVQGSNQARNFKPSPYHLLGGRTYKPVEASVGLRLTNNYIDHFSCTTICYLVVGVLLCVLIVIIVLIILIAVGVIG